MQWRLEAAGRNYDGAVVWVAAEFVEPNTADTWSVPLSHAIMAGETVTTAWAVFVGGVISTAVAVEQGGITSE